MPSSKIIDHVAPWSVERATRMPYPYDPCFWPVLTSQCARSDPSGSAVSEAFRRVIYETAIYFGRSTAREMGRVFELIARGELVSKPASDLMIAILKRQQVRNRIPRYLEDAVVAHKTGDGQPWIGNDAGIIWIGGQPVVLVVFTGRHRGSTAALHDAVARVAAIVVHHFGGKVDPAALPDR